MPTKLVAVPSKPHPDAKKRSGYPTLTLEQHLDLLATHLRGVTVHLQAVARLMNISPADLVRPPDVPPAA